MRMSKYSIPNKPMLCPFTGCVYNELSDGCDNPRLNRGNSDAVCHDIAPSKIVPHLTKREPDAYNVGQKDSQITKSQNLKAQ